MTVSTRLKPDQLRNVRPLPHWILRRHELVAGESRLVSPESFLPKDQTLLQVLEKQEWTRLARALPPRSAYSKGERQKTNNIVSVSDSVTNKTEQLRDRDWWGAGGQLQTGQCQGASLRKRHLIQVQNESLMQLSRAKEFQAEGTARAKARWWECAWPVLGRGAAKSRVGRRSVTQTRGRGQR